MKQNASILIGSEPGGAGKTTVMGALLGVIPHDHQIIPIPDADFLRRLPQSSSISNRTLIVHEIGTGPYYSYLSGPSIRDILKLIDNTTRFISNLHPDTIEKVLSTFKSFGIDDNLFTKINLVIFLEYNPRTGKRWMREVWESNLPDITHKLIYHHKDGFNHELNSLKYYCPTLFNTISSKIQTLISQNTTKIDEVAKFLI